MPTLTPTGPDATRTPAAPAPSPRQGTARAAGALAVGLVGVAGGLGIGLRHLQVVGVSAVTVAGLAVLVVGLALTAVAGTRLVRAVHGWRRLWAIPVALLLAWFVVWPITLALMVTNVPATTLSGETPADRGVAYEDVTVTTADGVDLAAWYVPSRNGAAVVLRHGAGSTRSDTLGHLVALAAGGYGVLATDARGHGASGGVAMDWGWYGDLDLDAAVGYLAARPEVDPTRIAVVGLSMGGEEALGAAASDDRIRAVVAEGASGRTLADDDLVLPDHPGRWMNIARDWLTFGITDWITGASPPIGLRSAVVAIAPRPVLLITGTDALGDEVTAGRRLRVASPGTVSLWEVDGATHTAALATDPDGWRSRVLDFLGTALPAS